MFTQTIIALTGVLALILTINGHKLVGSIIGIIGQPFWIWMALDKKLSGVLLVSIMYLAVWIYGLVTSTKDLK